MTSDTPLPPLFKILVDGESCHGGKEMQWSLPTKANDGTWAPGDWHAVEGKIELCSNGLHVTDRPVHWWKKDAAAYFVECDGDRDDGLSTQESRIAFRRVRLMRPATDEELFALNVFLSGYHAVKEGRCHAYDSATVEASGSATVEAYDSATVEASDSATVEASGSATVRAYDSATVRASDSATVEASKESNVIVSECYSVNVKVNLKDNAACIDRRSGKPVLIVAQPATA